MAETRKGWNIKQSFSDDFVDLMKKMSRKYDDRVFEIQGIANDNLDLVKFSKQFFKSASSSVADVSVDGNANVREKNVTAYNYEAGKALRKLNSLYLMYKWVKKFYHKDAAAEVIDKVISGEIFVNDLVKFDLAYCFAFELRNLMEKGMDFFHGNMIIAPPVRSLSFIALVIQTTAYISNQIAGACSYPDFFVCLDFYYRQEHGDDYAERMREDKELWQDIKNQFQNLIYSLNYPFRGAESPFTNLSVMDRGFLKQLFEGWKYPDGSSPQLESCLSLSKQFFEYYSSIMGKEGIFTFPIMTLAISLDEQGEYIDPDFVDWTAKANAAKAAANIFQSPPNSFSSCCRLISNLDKAAATGYQNSFGVGGLSIGSHRIVGLNLPRIALLEKDDPDILQKDLDIVHRILVAHRRLIARRIEDGFLMLYTHGWMHLRRQYSTVGFVGGYEYVVNKGLDITTDEGIEALQNVLGQMEKKITTWQMAEKKEGSIYNIEQIPAESTAVRLAQLDEIQGYNDNGWKLYSNQYLPLVLDASIYDRFKIQGRIDGHTSGGAILHLNVDDEKPLSPKQFRKIIEHAKDSGTVYFAVNYAYSMCAENHYVVGKHDNCPICDAKIVQQFSRVVGFITPTDSWNSVRREYEYPNRVFYSNGKVTTKDIDVAAPAEVPKKQVAVA